MTSYPKSSPVRDKSYRRWVGGLPCIRCGLDGHTQAAHGPSLGRGIKADDRTCVPLCADSPGRRGCHSLIDLYAVARREERAEMFAKWAEQTRAMWEAEHP
jgi:hypothetical protein